ncbi:response regulator [Pseudomonas sp. ArH3a]|uniref:response regulator n=1 Tax=Pseudomonas sp. ArH3a TaxID=2862945 RepID=UPI001F5AF95B|nr:response regulator [Pseudomonas sp. ArH3a]UNM22700.1 response regulator [Pseudomonas sp. ArH3a]
MINKTTRIMIADEEHPQRLRLERDFNHHGYYAIAPVCSLAEMLRLLEYGEAGFDIVLINAALSAGHRFDLSAFCLDHPLIHTALIYDLPEYRWLEFANHTDPRIFLSTLALPAGWPIKQLINNQVAR